MTLKDALLASQLGGGSGGSSGGVVTMGVELEFSLDNGWSGTLEDDNWNPLNYSDVLELTNNGADVALVRCGGPASPMHYDPEDETFYVDVYAYNSTLHFWQLVSVELSSNGYGFYSNIQYTDVAVGVRISKINDEYYSNLDYNAIAAILDAGGYVYVISKSNGVEDCVYTLDKYAYITDGSGYITFKRITYNTYNNVSTMWIEYFTINSSGVSNSKESYVLQPNT